MTNLVQTRTVADFVSENMARSRVFENFGIDYCCGGEIPLQEACTKRGLDPQVVLHALEAADSASVAGDTNLEELGPTRLAGMILSQHHAFLWEELPRLDDLHVHVCERHAAQLPHLMKSLELYRDLRSTLEAHMLSEEQCLFPLCSSIEHGSNPEIGKVLLPQIENHEEEHQTVGRMLADLRKLHNGYTAPEGSCRKHQALLSRLDALEQDIHLHVHKENNILFRQLRELLAG